MIYLIQYIKKSLKSLQNESFQFTAPLDKILYIPFNRCLNLPSYISKLFHIIWQSAKKGEFEWKKACTALVHTNATDPANSRPITL